MTLVATETGTNTGTTSTEMTSTGQLTTADTTAVITAAGKVDRDETKTEAEVSHGSAGMTGKGRGHQGCGEVRMSGR